MSFDERYEAYDKIHYLFNKVPRDGRIYYMLNAIINLFADRRDDVENPNDNTQANTQESIWPDLAIEDIVVKTPAWYDESYKWIYVTYCNVDDETLKDQQVKIYVSPVGFGGGGVEFTINEMEAWDCAERKISSILWIDEGEEYEITSTIYLKVGSQYTLANDANASDNALTKEVEVTENETDSDEMVDLSIIKILAGQGYRRLYIKNHWPANFVTDSAENELEVYCFNTVETNTTTFVSKIISSGVEIDEWSTQVFEVDSANGNRCGFYFNGEDPVQENAFLDADTEWAQVGTLNEYERYIYR